MNSRFTWRALSTFVFCWGGLQRVGRHRTFIKIWRGWHRIEWFQPGVPHSLSHSSYYKPSRKVNVYGTWAADVLFMSRSLPILWGSFSPLFFWFPKFDARPDFNCDDNSRRSGGQRRRLLYCESPIILYGPSLLGIMFRLLWLVYFPLHALYFGRIISNASLWLS